MAEVWFYHLERQPLEAVLPRILAGLMQRGEKACVHLPDAESRDDLSRQLWAYEDTGFMAHGVDGEEHGPHHRLWLTCAIDPLGASHRMYCGGLMPEDVAGAARVTVFISPGDQSCLEKARAAWKAFRAQGIAVKYWRQGETGRWEDQAAAKAA